MEEQEYLELREWAPLTDLWQQIPATLTKSLIIKSDVQIECIHAVDEFIALGSNLGIIFWYNRAKKQVHRLRCDSTSLTCIRIVSTVEYLVAAGDKNGNVFIYQIQKEHPEDLIASGHSLPNSKPERYIVRDLHKGPVKSIEWSKNGMKLFSGDKTGIIVLTELDFVKHESHSSVILREGYEIVQIRFQQPRLLLISSIFRTVICEKSDNDTWRLCQVGKKDRKLLKVCGGTFLNNDRPPKIICVRPGGRFWMADVEGTVHKTLVFKDIFEARRPDVLLINPSRKFMKITNEFELLHSYMEDYCVSFNEDAVFVLNLKKNRVEATVKYLRGVLDVAVNDQEIFILEGPRSVIRIAPSPDPFMDVRSTVFTQNFNKSLSPSSSSSFIASGSSSLYDSRLEDRSSDVELTDAAECKELAAIEHLDIDKLLEEAWPSQSTSGLVNVEEYNKKLEVFNQINDEYFDENILYRSRRMKVSEAVSPTSNGGAEFNGIVEIAQLAKTDTDEEEEEEVGQQVVEEREEIIEPVREKSLKEELELHAIPADDRDNKNQPPQQDDGEKIFLSEILNYSSRFISDDTLKDLMDGAVESSETKVDTECSAETPESIMENILLWEVKDIPADYSEQIEEEEEEDGNQDQGCDEESISMDSDWEIIKSFSTSPNSRVEDEEWSLDSDWIIVDDCNGTEYY